MNSYQEMQGRSFATNNNDKTGLEPTEIRRFFGLFLSNWFWFALTLFITLLLAYFVNHYKEKVFVVSSSLLIKDDQYGADLTGPESVLPGGDMFRNRQNLKNEIGILKSFSLNSRVINELPEFHCTIVGLGRRGIAETRHYKSAPFRILFDSLNKQRIEIPINLKITSDNTYTLSINGRESDKKEFHFGERFGESGFDFTIIKNEDLNFVFNPEESNRFIFWFNNKVGLANSYRSKLLISPVDEDATLVTLTVTGVSKLQETEYLNKLMDVYIQKGLEEKNKTAENTIDFINKQILEVADSLAKDETRMEEFRNANRIINVSSEAISISNKLETYTQEKVTANLRKLYYDYLNKYLTDKNKKEDIVSPTVMGVSDPLLINLIDELSRLKLQKEQMLYNLSEESPIVLLLDTKIETASNSLLENVKSGMLNIDLTLSDINMRIQNVEEELNKLPKTERSLINIQRKFDLNNTVYTYMLEKRSEASIAKASNVASNRVVDYAEPFNAYQIKPTTRKNYLFALILGFLIPAVYILLVDQLHNKIIDKRDIERGTSVPIIGFIGHNNSKSEFPVISKPGSSLSESFRSIRTAMKYYIKDNEKAIISVTSTLSGEGKTFISLNMAAILSMLNRKTLLIGMDLRKPRLNKILNQNNEIGLSSFLTGEVSYEDILRGTEIPNLYFVPSGVIPPNPAELIESEKMKEFIDRAKEEFYYIVIDTPPVGIVSDALLLGKYADINLFVIRQKYSFKSTLELIQNFSDRKELNNLTIAVNDIHISGYYGYGLRYGYGFYQGYGYYYGNSGYTRYDFSNYSKYYSED